MRRADLPSHPVLSEALIKVPEKTLEAMMAVLERNVFWFLRERMIKAKTSYPALAKQFAAELKKRGLDLPRGPYPMPESGMVIKMIPLDTEGMPANYPKPEEDVTLALVLSWLGKAKMIGADTLAGWWEKRDAIIVNMAGDPGLMRFPNKDSEISDIDFTISLFRSAIIHELRHAVQSKMLRARDARQVARDADYGKHGDAYFTSPIEFDPQIGSAVDEFVMSVKLAKERNLKVNLARDFRRYVGAAPSERFGMFSVNPLFAALKRRDPERYKLAIKKFHTELQKQMRETVTEDSTASFQVSPHTKLWVNVRDKRVIDCAPDHTAYAVNHAEDLGLDLSLLPDDVRASMLTPNGSYAGNWFNLVVREMGNQGWVRVYFGTRKRELSIGAIDTRSAFKAARIVADVVGDVRSIVIDIVGTNKFYQLHGHDEVEPFLKRGSLLNERFTLADTDPEALYGAFKASYEKETGAAWDEGKFASRARNWTFYGDENGYIAVRQQRSGMKKLVGVAGDHKSILRGLTELQAEGGPIWGAVSAPLAAMAKKRGMIVPHMVMGGPFFIKTLVKMIPPEVFGGHEPKVLDDGGIQFDYEDVGTTVKYLIGNKAYFLAAMKLPQVAEKLKAVPGLNTAIKFMGLAEGSINEGLSGDPVVSMDEEHQTYFFSFPLEDGSTLKIDALVSDKTLVIDDLYVRGGDVRFPTTYPQDGRAVGIYGTGVRIGPATVREVLRKVLDRVRRDTPITRIEGDRITGARAHKADRTAAMALESAEAEGDRYKVVWGPNQREAIGSHIVHAKSEMEAKKIGRKLLLNTYGESKFHGWKVLYAVKLDEAVGLTEKLISRDGTKVYDVQTKAEFAALLGKSRWKELRGFVNYSDDEVIAWDSDAAVHPDIRRSLGVFGVPVHLSADRITIRHHGMEDFYLWQMMHDLMDCAQLKRIYGGTLPPIYGDDGEALEERLDTKDWSHVEGGDPSDHWEDNWRSY